MAAAKAAAKEVGSGQAGPQPVTSDPAPAYVLIPDLGTRGDGGHFTEESDKMLMFCPPMSSPLTSQGLSAMFRCSAISVP